MTPALSQISLFGHDPLFDGFAQMTEHGLPSPAFNVQKLGDDRFAVTLAVPGYSHEKLSVSTQDGRLTVTGHTSSDHHNGIFLHREISDGDFRRSFQLADYVNVVAADLKDGLLRIELVRELPDELKPRRIEIKSDKSKPLLSSDTSRERAA